MKRIIAIILSILSLAGLVVSLAGCGSEANAQTQTSQTFTVQRGNLETYITATGNLAYMDKEDLVFEVGGTSQNPMSVEEVLVEEGDMVEKGQVLAKLDASAWQDHLDTLQTALTTAQRQETSKDRALTAAERTLDTKKSALDSAERQVSAKELDLRQKELNLQSAQYTLNQLPYVKSAQHNVDLAEAKLTLAQAELEQALAAKDQGNPVTYSDDTATVTVDSLMADVISAQKAVADAKAELQNTISLSGVTFSSDVATDIATKALAVDQAQKAVEDAKIAIDDANTAIKTAQYAVDDAQDAVTDAQTALNDAKKDVEDAQQTLDEEKVKSIEVIAPFDGFIIAVNVKGGDEVNKGQVACTIADPNKFECSVLVSEMDISSLEVGGDATLSIDSLDGLSFPAKVTYIASTATVSQGVVNFTVKVELESSTSQQDVQLREGLTATVNIVLDKKENVLLVPIKTISSNGNQTYVNIKSPDGSIETRSVETGITDYQNTEIVSGLTEGEQVVIVTNTSSTTTSSIQQQSQSGVMIPGVSGPSGGPPPGGM